MTVQCVLGLGWGLGAIVWDVWCIYWRLLGKKEVQRERGGEEGENGDFINGENVGDCWRGVNRKLDYCPGGGDGRECIDG